MKNPSEGFTLIELLVVIAIIGLMASMIMTQVTISRAKGRDGKRTEETRSLVDALELMRGKLGHFPCHYIQNDTDPTFMKAFVDAGVLPKKPADPSGGFYVYEYGTVNSTPNSLKCGDIAFLGVYFEAPGFKCPSFGIMATDGPNHCHIWYPTGITNCAGFDPNVGPISNTAPGQPCEAYANPSSMNEY